MGLPSTPEIFFEIVRPQLWRTAKVYSAGCSFGPVLVSVEASASSCRSAGAACYLKTESNRLVPPDSRLWRHTDLHALELNKINTNE